MERTLNLKKLQIWITFKQSLLVFAVLSFIGLVILGLTYFTGNASLEEISILFATSFSGMMKNITILFLSLLSVTFVTFAFLLPLNDGITGLDSALRFGISRNHYLVISLTIYFAIALLSAFLTPFLDLSAFMNSSLGSLLQESLQNITLTNVLKEFSAIIVWAILGYIFYLFGWKGIGALCAIIIVFMSTVMIGYNSVFFLNFLNLLNHPFITNLFSHPLIIASVLALILILIFAVFIKRSEIRD